MSLAVLTDAQIRSLLDNLTLEELEAFRDSLKSALHDYSTNTQAADDGDIHQPNRTAITSTLTGATTLFMPSCSKVGVGVKVITLSPPRTPPATEPPPDEDPPLIRPTGAIALFSKSGSPMGLLHASTLTAFRTALASACLLWRRDTVRTLAVFGAGEQAYWHVRLALLLRGATIRAVNIINHRFSPAVQTILKRLYSVPSAVKLREGWAQAQFAVLTPGYTEYARLLRAHLRDADVVFCCTPATRPLFDHAILTSHEGRRKGRLIVAVGSYTPAMRELPVELLQQATRTHRGDGVGHHMHYHKHAVEGGVVVVDTLDGALREAGEIIDAGLNPQQLVELGELVMLHRITMAEEEESETSSTSSIPSGEFDKLDLTPGTPAMSSVFSVDSGSTGSSGRTSSSPSRKRSSGFGRRRSSSSASTERRKAKDDGLARWLQKGNVIYKSVGLGLMDLSVGLHLIEFARQKGVGSHIEGF